MSPSKKKFRKRRGENVPITPRRRIRRKIIRQKPPTTGEKFYSLSLYVAHLREQGFNDFKYVTMTQFLETGIDIIANTREVKSRAFLRSINRIKAEMGSFTINIDVDMKIIFTYDSRASVNYRTHFPSRA